MKYSKLPDFALQKRLDFLNGKISELDQKIKNTSAESPEMEDLLNLLEELKEEKEKVEKELEIDYA